MRARTLRITLFLLSVIGLLIAPFTSGTANAVEYSCSSTVSLRIHSTYIDTYACAQVVYSQTSLKTYVYVTAYVQQRPGYHYTFAAFSLNAKALDTHGYVIAANSIEGTAAINAGNQIQVTAIYDDSTYSGSVRGKSEYHWNDGVAYNSDQFNASAYSGFVVPNTYAPQQ